uniref:Uncharacterized protein n=1 Tax=Oryza nivara TaxID=4536 RepID=A0A0E0HVI7_ORYNI
MMGGSSSSLQSQLCLGVREETGGGEGQNGGGGEGGGGGHIHQPNDEGAPVVQEHGHRRPGHDVAAGRRAGHRPRCRGARLQHTGLATECSRHLSKQYLGVRVLVLFLILTTYKNTHTHTGNCCYLYANF